MEQLVRAAINSMTSPPTKLDGKHLPLTGNSTAASSPTLSTAEDRPSWAVELDGLVDDISELLVEIRRHLHRNPELSGGERQTTHYLTGLLRQSGLTPNLEPEDCGAVVDGPNPGNVQRVALRGDLDALPIQDAKDCEYRSRVDGAMHACGHDAHAACLTGCALVLHRLHRSGGLPWPVPWRVILQPSEEQATGARAMIDRGVLNNVKAIFGLHMDPSRPVGEISLRDGPMTAACDELNFRIQGQGGHSARPQNAKDPVMAAAMLISEVYQLLPRRTNPFNPVLATIGSVTAGTAANTIPKSALLKGMLRYAENDSRIPTQEALREIARGVESSTGCAIEVTFPVGCAGVKNDARLNRLIFEAANHCPTPVRVVELPHPSMGGEDFGEYTLSVPGGFFRLGCQIAPDYADLHSPLFDLDERCLTLGVRLLVRAAVLCSRPQRTA